MATKRTKRVVNYITSRLQEPSTIRGLILVATVAGAKLTPEAQTAILEIGLLLSGLFAVATPDKYQPSQPKEDDK